jgi:hypothetical protein
MYDDKEWIDLSSEIRGETIKYLKLIRRFKKDHKLVPMNHKKWMLENSDLPTYLIPNEILDDMSLWLD